MEILKEMKKKILSVFNQEPEKNNKQSDSSNSVRDSLNAEEKVKLDDYPSLRHSTPENRDISPY